MEPAHAAPAELSRYRSLVRIFELHVSDCVSPAEREKPIRSLYGATAAQKLSPILQRIAQSVRTGAQRQFAELCQQYDIENKLKTLDAISKQPIKTPAELQVDVDRFVETQVASLSNLEENRRLQAEKLKLEKEAHEAKIHLESLRSERHQKIRELNALCAQLSPLLLQLQSVSTDFNESELNKWIAELMQQH